MHSWFRETVPLHGYGFSFDVPVLADINPWAVALSAAALIAIFCFKAGTIQTLAACSAAGMLLCLSGVVTP